MKNKLSEFPQSEMHLDEQGFKRPRRGNVIERVQLITRYRLF